MQHHIRHRTFLSPDDYEYKTWIQHSYRDADYHFQYTALIDPDFDDLEIHAADHSTYNWKLRLQRTKKLTDRLNADLNVMWKCYTKVANRFDSLVMVLHMERRRRDFLIKHWAEEFLGNEDSNPRLRNVFQRGLLAQQAYDRALRAERAFRSSWRRD